MQVADTKPTRLHPGNYGLGLHFDYCSLPSPISLTIVYLNYKGLTSLEVQANASLQRERFAEVGSPSPSPTPSPSPSPKPSSSPGPPPG